MTQFTDPGPDSDDVVRRLRGALDELTADISETTVADRLSAGVRDLRQRPSRRTWLVPAAAAAAVVAVVAGVVVVGNRDDGGPSGPPVSVPDTGMTVPVDQTVAGATFAPLDGLEPAGVPTFNTVMTAPLGAVWVSAEGPDDWFVSVRQESDRELSPGTLDGGVELEPVDTGGRTLYVDPDNGSGKPTVYEWRPGDQLYVVDTFGLDRDRLVGFVASIEPGSGVPFIQTSDDPEFSGAEVAILDPQPTYVQQSWTLDGAAVRLSAATGGLARHLADLAASTLTVESVTVVGESGYRVEATDGTHVLWPSAAGGNVWVSATIPTNDRVDEVIGSVVQQPTGLVVGGTMAALAQEQSALRGWRTRVVEGDLEGRPLADVVSESLSSTIVDGVALDDAVPSTAPVVIDALTFADRGEIVKVALDLTATRQVVLVTAMSESADFDTDNETLRALAESTADIAVADWAEWTIDPVQDGSQIRTFEDWIALVTEALLSDEGER
jgi:hypothetical protein